MSLAIDVNKVTEVLIGGTWLEVCDGTFDLDSYEFMEGASGAWEDCIHGGGTSGVCATGFAFCDNDGRSVAGPLTAIQAVKYCRPVPNEDGR